MPEPLLIGRLQSLPNQVYSNNMKLFGSYLAFPASAGVLADLIIRGKLLAGPVSSLDFARILASGAKPLSDFGLYINPYMAYEKPPGSQNAAQALIHAPLVMLAKKPLEEFSRMRVGISEEILNSEREALLLTKLLLSFYWEVEHDIRMEVSLDDDAWICQGGPYLALRSKRFFGFPYAYDLAWEWYRWKRSPYLFYRWVLSPGLDQEIEDDIVNTVRKTLELNLRDLAQLAHHEASLKGVERSEVLSYLHGFGHRLGLWQSVSQGSVLGLAGLLKDSEISAFR
ncbi:MAG: hypothetical protein HY401_04865 [Elusimicrobia bacterium]|nr:hypothetical protein [Elusimicrobiota bacterium]